MNIDPDTNYRFFEKRFRQAGDAFSELERQSEKSGQGLRLPEKSFQDCLTFALLAVDIPDYENVRRKLDDNFWKKQDFTTEDFREIAQACYSFADSYAKEKVIRMTG